jgi:hypothetical protein
MEGREIFTVHNFTIPPVPLDLAGQPRQPHKKRRGRATRFRSAILEIANSFQEGRQYHAVRLLQHRDTAHKQ